MGPGYFYTFGIESFLDAKPQLPHHCPLLYRFNIAQNLDIYSGVAQIINPQHLGRTLDYFTPFCILSEFFALLGLSRLWHGRGRCHRLPRH